MDRKLKYLLICILAMLVVAACKPSNSTTALKIGDAVPNISWTTITGEKIDLKQFKGSWVLLCYWCSCTEHRNDILIIRDIYDALYDKNLKVVVIQDTDYGNMTLSDFSEKDNSPLYLVHDTQKSINIMMPDGFEDVSRPKYFLIDTAGNLHDIKRGTFSVGLHPPTRLTSNDWEAMDIYKYQLNQNQLKTLDVLIFLYDAIAVKFNDITITNVTANGATVKWKTEKAVPCWLDFKAPPGYCTNKTVQSTNYQWILDDFIPDSNYVFTITAYGFDRSKLRLPIDMSSSSNEYSFNTLKSEYDTEYSSIATHEYKSIFTAPKISEATISNVTDTSAEIHWKTDKVATSVATISFSDDTGKEVSVLREDNDLTKNHTFIMDKLEPRKLYSIDLRSEDALGRFDMYSLGFVTQPKYYSYRTHIYNFSITDITDSSATFNWSTGNPTFCTICTPNYCFLEESRVRTKDTKHSWTLSDLAPEKEYWVQIQTREAVSDVFNFKTIRSMAKVDIE